MNRSMVAAARRHIAELEARVTRQEALIDGLVAGNRDANAATRTLRILENALSLTKAQLQFALRDEGVGSLAEARRAS
jgi:uncharacterized coiled-coil protein SlyX